jgi:hypothetical protein
MSGSNFSSSSIVNQAPKIQPHDDYESGKKDFQNDDIPILFKNDTESDKSEKIIIGFKDREIKVNQNIKNVDIIIVRTGDIDKIDHCEL